MKPNYGFAKRQRELAKKQKKEEKRQRKQAEDVPATAEGAQLSTTDQPQTDTPQQQGNS